MIKKSNNCQKIFKEKKILLTNLKPIRLNFKKEQGFCKKSYKKQLIKTRY